MMEAETSLDDLKPLYFEAGEQLFFERYYYEDDSLDITRGSVFIPEGYTIFYIENFEEGSFWNMKTKGCDVWFINTTLVVVDPLYNRSSDIYDYSRAGVPFLDYFNNVSNDTLSRHLYKNDRDFIF